METPDVPPNLDLSGSSARACGGVANYCSLCDKTFTAKKSYKRHLEYSTAHAERQFLCSVCQKAFSRRDDRLRHENKRACKPPSEAAQQPADAMMHLPETLDRRPGTLTVQHVAGFPSSRLPETVASTVHLDSPALPPLIDIIGAPMDYDGLFDFSPPAQSPLPAQHDDGMDAIYEPTELFNFDFPDWRQWVDDSPQMSPDAYQSDVPALSRGNSPTSNHSVPEMSDAEQDPTRSDRSLKALPMVPGLYPGYRTTSSKRPVRYDFHKRHPRKDVRCTLCKEYLGKDRKEIGAHFAAHLHDLQSMRYVCEQCNLHFAHPADLRYHHECTKNGKCGFPSPPPNSQIDLNTPAGHDIVSSTVQLREWENSTLQLASSTVQRAIKAISRGSGTSRFSIRSTPLARFSAGSWTYSLKSFRSETVDVDQNAILDAVEKGVASLHIRDKTVRVQWQKAQPLNCEASTINTKIHDAARRDDDRAIEYLLHCGGDVDAVDDKYSAGPNRLTALMVAADSSSIGAVECLVRCGANVRATDELGRTAAHLACINRCAIKMPSLFSLQSIFTNESQHDAAENVMHQTALVEGTNLTSISKLMSRQHPTKFRVLPAVHFGLWQLIGIVRPLFSHARALGDYVPHGWIGDVFLRRIKTEAVIDRVLEAGRVDLLHILLAILAVDADHAYDNGCRVFADAATACLDQVFRFLSRKLPTIHRLQDPSILALRRGIITSTFKNLDIFITELVALGANVKTGRLRRCPASPTPLYIAIVCGLKDTTELLIETIDAAEKSRMGEAFSDKVSVKPDYELLVRGETALVAAARLGNLTVVRLLLAKGANPAQWTGSPDRCLEHCAPDGHLACQLKQAVAIRRLDFVRAQMDGRLTAGTQPEDLDYFGALYSAIELEVNDIAVKILETPHWKISSDASTALLEVSIALWGYQNDKGRRDAANVLAKPRRELFFLNICNSLINAGAGLSASSIQSFRTLVQGTDTPAWQTYMLSVM